MLQRDDLGQISSPISPETPNQSPTSRLAALLVAFLGFQGAMRSTWTGMFL